MGDCCLGPQNQADVINELIGLIGRVSQMGDLEFDREWVESCHQLMKYHDLVNRGIPQDLPFDKKPENDVSQDIYRKIPESD